MVLVMGMLAGMALAQTSTVTSVNAVGYNSVEIDPGDFALVVLPFEMFEDSTIENLVGDQLAVGSWCYIWDRPTDSYVSGSRGRGGWTLTNLILRGDAFWLKNGGASTSTVSFLGEVPEEYNDAMTTTVYSILGTDATGYAYPTDVQWTNTALAEAAASGSWLYIWDVVAQGYDSYSKGRGGWSTPAGFTISAGRGFWVKTTSTIDWTEVAPYDL